MEKNRIEAKERYQNFCRFLSEIRNCFVDLGFLETPTPTLVSCPGMEAHLDPIATDEGHFLPTSPEIHLKRLLCLGFEHIFELRPCFRKDPETALHRREFQMLEWYRAGGTPQELIKDIAHLLGHLKAKGLWEKPIEFQTHTFQSLFRNFFEFDFTPQTTDDELRGLLDQKGLHWAPSDSKVDLIHRILIDVFEPSFSGLTILKEFPAEMAILSAIGSNGFAERFELFYGATELANAFHEVTDPNVQRLRWQQDERERKTLGKQTITPDVALLEEMSRYGLPPCSGIALGVDRLFMIAQDLNEISLIRPF